MAQWPHAVDDPDVDAVELPIGRDGGFTLFCSGPRRDGRFGLHRTSPSEPPFAFAWTDGGGWSWATVDGQRDGVADSLEECLRAAGGDR